VDAFEKEVANYIGVDHAAALSSGTAALHLALKIIGVEKGDTVFCSDLTFVASPNAIRYLDANPIFIDSEESTWNMCPKSLELAFSIHKPKVVVITDLYGQSADYTSLKTICDRFNTPIIEDAAESLGASYINQKCGSFGEMAILSFNGNKIITTSGGGMLLSNHSKYIEQAKKLSTQAREPAIHYEHEELGYNYRMSNIIAAIGRAQLKQLGNYVEKRRKIYNYYKAELSHIPHIQWMPEAKGSRSSRWLSILTLPSNSEVLKNDIINKFAEENIEARPVWKPMHLQPLYQSNNFFSVKNNGPVSENLYNRGICLPSGSSLSEKEQSRIVAIINSFFS